MFGLSGTLAFGRSGTAGSVDREPQSPSKPRKCDAFAARNIANMESFGFLLTPPRLCRPEGSDPPCGTSRYRAGGPPLTHVTLVWRQGQHEDWLRFGKPVAGRIIDRRTRIESYAPGQVFALVRWASDAFGTSRSTLDVVRAVGHGEACTSLPQVDPGGELLLSVRGWPGVRRVFALIDAIEQAGTDPCDVAPEHWRHIHNRLAASMQPRVYRADCHRAWLQRRRLQP